MGKAAASRLSSGGRSSVQPLSWEPEEPEEPEEPWPHRGGLLFQPQADGKNAKTPRSKYCKEKNQRLTVIGRGSNTKGGLGQAC